MGRRGIPVTDPARWVFNRLAGAYAHRPPYPPALADRLAALAGGPGSRAADLGAGTGLLAWPLAARGLRVWAVEPAEEMLGALRAGAGGDRGRDGDGDPDGDRDCDGDHDRGRDLDRGLGGDGGMVVPVHAAAEATGLPGGAFDLVLLADALHWVDPEEAGAEVGRLLAPGGALAVVEAAPAPGPFMDGLGALLARYNPRAPPPAAGRLRQLLAVAGAGTATAEPFLQEADLSAPALEGVLRSLSHVGPARGEAALAGLLAEARELAGRCGGARLARRLTLTWARRPASPPGP